MAITDINISEQLQTGAPSIRYSGTEGPQSPQQHQQAQMIAQQIWEALGPEQQSQFQSFEEFFRSGVWKQILAQMQQDEAQDQGQGPQAGIGSLGPQPMEQQMPTPNRMGAEYGGRIGFQRGSPHSSPATEAYSSMGETDKSALMRNINYLMSEHGLSREEALNRVTSEFRKPLTPNRIGAYGGGDMEELSMRETIDTPEGIETLQETDTMKMAGGGERGWKAQMLAQDLAQEKYGKDFYDLSDDMQHEIYTIALDMIDSGGE